MFESIDDHDVLQQMATQEIESLHRFFVDWFTGALRDDREIFETHCLRRFDPGFVLISPSGSTAPLEALVDGIRRMHGSNPVFRIQIRNVNVRAATQDLLLVVYEEWQKNAKASTPPNNARIGSVVFRREDDRLRWFHLQETALPPETVEADAFAFDR